MEFGHITSDPPPPPGPPNEEVRQDGLTRTAIPDCPSALSDEDYERKYGRKRGERPGKNFPENFWTLTLFGAALAMIGVGVGGELGPYAGLAASGLTLLLLIITRGL